MKKKQVSKKVTLKKQTIAALQTSELNNVLGGVAAIGGVRTLSNNNCSKVRACCA